MEVEDFNFAKSMNIGQKPTPEPPRSEGEHRALDPQEIASFTPFMAKSNAERSQNLIGFNRF